MRPDLNHIGFALIDEWKVLRNELALPDDRKVGDSRPIIR